MSEYVILRTLRCKWICQGDHERIISAGNKKKLHLFSESTQAYYMTTTTTARWAGTLTDLPSTLSVPNYYSLPPNCKSVLVFSFFKFTDITTITHLDIYYILVHKKNYAPTKAKTAWGGIHYAFLKIKISLCIHTKYISRCIVKTMYLEMPKVVIWDEGSTSIILHLFQIAYRFDFSRFTYIIVLSI